MSKFRKKPVEIDAEQYTKLGKLIRGMCNSRSCFAEGNNKPHIHEGAKKEIINLKVGDWVFSQDGDDRFYALSDEAFKSIYEPENRNGEI